MTPGQRVYRILIDKDGAPQCRCAQFVKVEENWVCYRNQRTGAEWRDVIEGYSTAEDAWTGYHEGVRCQGERMADEQGRRIQKMDMTTKKIDLQDVLAELWLGLSGDWQDPKNWKHGRVPTREDWERIVRGEYPLP